MKRLSQYILIFSVLFAVLLIAPAFLGEPFPLYPLMSWGDVLDILTPLVLLPLYWMLFWYASNGSLKLRECLFFVLFAAMWAEGQGMHLSANSIGHLLDETPLNSPYQLTGFYDEKLSHYLWHIGIFALAAILIFVEWRQTENKNMIVPYQVIPAGIIHGLTLFLIIVEAGTVLLGIFTALLVVIIFLIWGKRRLREEPLIFFFFISFIVTLIFCIGWAIYWGGFPEFSDIGII
jgi:hypothetical protein